MIEELKWPHIWEVIKTWFVYQPDAPLLFNSTLFLGLFIVFYAFYLGILNKFRGRLLYVVCFSLFFYYKSSGVFFLLLIGSSIIDYILANKIYKSDKTGLRKILLGLSIVSNLGILGYFKYTNFFIRSLNHLSGSEFQFYTIFLPVGVSFFTFQSISYSVEVYRKDIAPTKRFLDYLFYISFFPQLVAGPIVKAKDFIPQIYQKIQLTKADYNRAFLLIISGLIKKAVISDYISVNFVDRVFDAPLNYSAFENLMATYGYSIQIYCDFSGYSDMAIGIALLMGYKLPLNFRTPYQSQSITEFWRRWHISLSTWLKEFLYFSVGGNRKGTFWGYFFPAVFFIAILWFGIDFYNTGKWPLIIGISSLTVFLLSILISKDRHKAKHTNSNLMTTMLLGGLWHGANIRFIIWGALHGLALAFHKLITEIFPRKKGRSPSVLWNIIAVLITFHFVTFCWIFFRAQDFSQAIDMLEQIQKLQFNFKQWREVLYAYAPVFLITGFAFIWHYLPKKLMQQVNAAFTKVPFPVQALILAVIYWAIYATASSETQAFIYFQF